MKKYLLLLLCSTWTILAVAQEIQITSQNIPQEVTFAQPFDVQFEVSHTPGYTPRLDQESLPKDFELTQAENTPLSADTLRFQGTFFPFAVKASTFTAVTFQLTDSQGNVVAQAQSKPQTVTIRPVQYFKDKDIRDIRPPYIPASLFWWLLCLLAALAIAYWLWHFYRHVKEQAKIAAAAPDNRSADEIALSKIQLLLQSGLWENAQYKIFYIELGNILREYFWKRFSLDVSADTSAELIRRARHVPDLAPLLYLLRDYLASSDLVKFAKVVPSEATMNQDVVAVQTLVKKTTPAPVQATAEEQP